MIHWWFFNGKWAFCTICTSFRVRNILLLAKIYFSDKVLLWVTQQPVTLISTISIISIISTIYPGADPGPAALPRRGPYGDGGVPGVRVPAAPARQLPGPAVQCDGQLLVTLPAPPRHHQHPLPAPRRVQHPAAAIRINLHQTNIIASSVSCIMLYSLSCHCLTFIHWILLA